VAEESGGRTPLLEITRSQADALEKKLLRDGIHARVSFGMKHWHPFVEDVVEKISADNPPILVGVALAPHYSKLSVGGYEIASGRPGKEKCECTVRHGEELAHTVIVDQALSARVATTCMR